MWSRLSPERRAQCALLVGPYDHGGAYHENSDSTPVRFPGGSLAEAFPDLALQWFDHIRGGTPLTSIRKGQVAYYALYENRWHVADTLANGPVSRTFYLNQTDQGARTLETRPAPAAEMTYAYDPRDPAPFPGGLCLAFGGMPVQPDPDFRPDVVSCLSAPFQQVVDVRGRMTACLHCKSDCEDTCFYMRLSLVKADGKAYPLRDDITSLCYERPDYTPGTVQPVHFCFSDHAFRIVPGERLRVDVSSSCRHYLPHSNLKGLQSAQHATRMAHNTILCGPSSITLRGGMGSALK